MWARSYCSVPCELQRLGRSRVLSKMAAHQLTTRCSLFGCASGVLRFVRARHLPLLSSSPFHSTPISHSNDLIGADHVVRSPFPDIQLPTDDLYTLVTKNLSKHGSRTAIVDGISGREYSFNELGETFSKFSTGIRQQGFCQGDVMALVTPNSPEYSVLYMGTLAAGGTVSTCNPGFTADELAFQFKNSNAKYVATVPQVLPTVQEAAAKSQVERIVVVDTADPQNSKGELLSYTSLISHSGPLLEPVLTAPHDVVVLPYSSGTTGFPKGVMLTNFSVSSNILQMSHADGLSLNTNTVLLGLVPFFHIYGMVVGLLSSFVAGSKIVALPRFEPESFLSTIEKYRINNAQLVPPLILFLAKHPLVNNYNITSIKDIFTAAAPLGGDLVKAACERTGCKLIRQGYGLTEASPITHMMPKSLGLEVPSSIGNCLKSVQVKVVDPESNQALPPNKEGELWIRGPNVMKGYLNNPSATQDCLTEDGWFKSGDIGYYDERGLFYITDRLKELIKVKGLQVAPAELEALLLTHPKIADVAVIGTPNEWLGEAPKAFVVRKDGSLSEKEVEEFVAEKKAKHKHLAGGVTFLEAVPKSPSGKILRRMLRQQ